MAGSESELKKRSLIRWLSLLVNSVWRSPSSLMIKIRRLHLSNKSYSSSPGFWFIVKNDWDNCISSKNFRLNSLDVIYHTAPTRASEISWLENRCHSKRVLLNTLSVNLRENVRQFVKSSFFFVYLFVSMVKRKSTCHNSKPRPGIRCWLHTFFVNVTTTF